MTPAESATVRVAGALDICGIAYMLTGSFASNYYGIPRSTNDADFVLELQTATGSSFASRLGPELELDPQLSFETVTGTFRQLIYLKSRVFKIELFLLSKDPHDQVRFARRRAVRLFNQQIWLPSPEDVIVTKLRWARGKDKDDVKAVMAVQREKLDWNYIARWCEQHGSLAVMEELRRSVPEI